MKTVIRNSYTPKIGDYCETIVVDKETNNAYIFDCDGVFTLVPQPVDVDKILEEAAAYTDEQVAPLAEKLDTIEEGAQVNVIEHVLENGTELTITNKTVNVTVPTKTSDLTNDGSDGTDTYVESAALDNYYTKDETDTQIGYETTAREIADQGLQEQIDAIVASSDVVDIVGTYAALQNYDTSTLSANDIVKVLTDESKDDATTYYRWTGSTWTYIGAEGPFYTKAESDALFTPMTRTINGKALSSDIILTAADVHALPDSTVIPTVNDATLTIQKNGATVQTFTANQATNATANITVPTKTSDITNDSGFITEEDVYEEVCETGKTITFQDSAPSSLSSFRLDGETSQQTYTGKNLFNLNTSTKGSSGSNNAVSSVVSNSDLTITQTGNGGNGYVWFEIPNSDSLLGKTVSISVGSMAHSGTTSTGRIIIYTNNLSVVANFSSITSSGWSASFSFPSSYPSGASSFRVYAYLNNANTTTSVGSTTKFTNIQLELGSSTSSYEPYVGGTASPNPDYPQAVQTVTGANVVKISDGQNEQSYEVNLGKNLFDTSEVVKGRIDSGVIGYQSNVTNLTLSDNSFTFTVDAAWRGCASGVIEVLPGTSYHFKATPSSAMGGSFVDYYGASGWLSRYQVPGAGMDYSFTTPANCIYVRFSWQTSAVGTFTISNPQCEKGSQATSYAAYFEPIELCKIGDYQDYIYKSGDKWYVHKETAKVSATSSDFSSTSASGGYYRAVIALSGIANSSQSGRRIGDAITNLFHGSTTDGAGAQFQTQGNMVVYANSTTQTYAQLMTIIDSSSMVVYYTLATPTDTEITNQALIAQLETLLNTARTYAGVNNIFTVTPNEQGTLEICYVNTILPYATKDKPGIVQIGDGLSVDSNGVISSDGLTSVDWDDIDDKPTNVSYWANDAGYITAASLPTVNNATLTIQKNGTDVASFTANSSTNQTANITVPTDTSDLTNGAGFITTAALSNYYTKSETYTQNEVNTLINSLSIPTKTSDLVNDSGFLTSIPVASANDLGGVKIGTGLSIDADGVLSVTSAGAVAWTDITGKPTDVSYWTNDAGYITSADIPTNVSSFTNDAGYITSSDIPTNVSAFTNDAGYLTSSALSNYYTKGETYSQGEVNALINTIAIPTKTSDLTNDGDDGVHAFLATDDVATVATTGDYEDLTNTPSIPDYQAGDHIDITNGTISAIDYVHSENPVSITTPGTTVSGSEITDGSIGFSKVDSTQFLKLQLTTTDPGEGAALAANTLLGVYQ